MKTFQEYIKEDQGVVDIVDDPTERIHQPDIVTPIANIKTTSTGTSVPMHWGGGRRSITSGMRFGANPKEDNRVLSYHEFIKTTKGFSKEDTSKK